MASGWVAVDGGWDTGSLRSLAARVVRPGMTDAEKAWAIWELVGRITYRMSLHATSDPLELVNVYGYGYCSTVNRLVPALWQAAGLRARGVRLHGDYNCEVFYDGSWHLLNAYMRTCYLRADGDGAASAEDLIADPGLVERNVTGTGTDAKEDVPGRTLAACFAHATPDERDLTATAYSPRATLRGRERLTRRWDHRGAWSHSVTEPAPLRQRRAGLRARSGRAGSRRFRWRGPARRRQRRPGNPRPRVSSPETAPERTAGRGRAARAPALSDRGRPDGALRRAHGARGPGRRGGGGRRWGVHGGRSFGCVGRAPDHGGSGPGHPAAPRQPASAAAAAGAAGPPAHARRGGRSCGRRELHPHRRRRPVPRGCCQRSGAGATACGSRPPRSGREPRSCTAGGRTTR